MNIYKHEVDIKNLVKAMVSTCIAVPIAELKPKTKVDNSKIVKAKEVNPSDLHPDMLYGSCILASTSMNKNDDVFLPEETWAARFTPINTPYNEEHNEKKIIGHITNSYVLTNSGEVYTGTDIPDYFDIGVDFVLYKDIYPALAEEISILGPEKRAFVSMEATMDGFDYALVHPNGNVKIVERNDDTSFLTKALRVFGGNGKYGDYRVGRVLRDFRFTGMGNVDDPANPKSIYTNICTDNDVSAKSLSRASRVNQSKDINQENNMLTDKETIAKLEDEIKTLKDAQAAVKDINEKLKAAEQALAAKDAEIEQRIKATETQYTEKASKVQEQLTAVQAAKEDAEKEKDKNKKDKEDAEAKLELLAKKMKDDAEEYENAKKKSKAMELENDAYKAKLKAYQDAERGEQRGLTIANLGFTVDEKDKSTYASMTDEAFNSLLSFAEKNKKDDKKQEDEDKKKKDAEAALKAQASTNTNDAGDPANTIGGSASDEDKLRTIASNLVTSLRSKKEKAKKVVNKE